MRASPFLSPKENFMNSSNSELLVKWENILAPNQKVPSVPEACVSSLAISQYLPHLCDQEMAAAQTLVQWRLGTEVVGGERYNLSLANASMWAKASADYSSSAFCDQDCFVPFGTDPAEASCPPLSNTEPGNLGTRASEWDLSGILNVHYETCSWQEDDAVGCLPFSLPVWLHRVGVMRNLQMSTDMHMIIIYYIREFWLYF